jgi:phosphoribosylamine---glycine ligase
VIIAEDASSARAAIHGLMVDRRFGAAGNQVVVEEFLEGVEASYFVIADGTRFVPFSSAQDHKRIFDDDRGPNTGGMGAFAPSPVITPAVEQQIVAEIVTPVLEGMMAEGNSFRGFLYVGLMLTADGPKVIEFNVRLGDPEAQVIVPMLDESLALRLAGAARGELPLAPMRFRNEPHVAVVLAAGGYPDAPLAGHVISGVAEAARVPGARVFHAGTALRSGELVTAGGRVLSVVGSGPTYTDAISTAYQAASHIHFDGMQLRRDIGRKALAVR